MTAPMFERRKGAKPTVSATRSDASGSRPEHSSSQLKGEAEKLGMKKDANSQLREL